MNLQHNAMQFTQHLKLRLPAAHMCTSAHALRHFVLFVSSRGTPCYYGW